MGIERQGTRATKHDGSVVLLRKILKELKTLNREWTKTRLLNLFNIMKK